MANMIPKNNQKTILKLLAGHIPTANPTLHYSNPFELLVAVMLSAQCTDRRVNIITARLFTQYRTPRDFAALEQKNLAEEIRDCGLYRNKSRHIIETSRILLDKFGGLVPHNLEDLESLPGVGRKTANVVLSVAFGIPAFPVDTHIFRVTRRLGLSNGKNPLLVEQDLTRLIPPSELGIWHHRLIHFGRSTCTARKPDCDNCVVRLYCPSRISL
ncbi:MAG: endonuclease III [Peptococcaceae bacterium BRH_c8a]|nr:MAG: endonuclease III [Peptococcaceae bacterium BRH_c8a]